jgi:hypothetical protein
MPRATSSQGMVSKIAVSGAPVVLEETPIIDIAKRFGATLARRGDAGDALEWVCIDGTGPGGNWVLRLESGEIDGGTIGGFRWQWVSSGSAFDQRCQKLKAGNVELPDRLRLGLAKEEVRTILGGPSAWRREKAIYFHEHTEPLHGEMCTSDNILDVFFRDGKVQAIDVWKTTSD